MADVNPFYSKFAVGPAGARLCTLSVDAPRTYYATLQTSQEHPKVCSRNSEQTRMSTKIMHQYVFAKGSADMC